MSQDGDSDNAAQRQLSPADLAGRIAQALRDGEFRDAQGLSAMPSQAALSARFQVGRYHIRKAQALLATMGLLDLHQGRLPRSPGPMSIEYGIKSRTRWTDIVSSLAGEPGFRVLEVFSRRATGAESARLALRPSGRVIEVKVERSWNDAVLCLASHQFPEARFAGLDSAVHEVQRISDLHRRFGIMDYLRNDSQITARRATPAERAALRIGREEWVFKLSGRNIDLDGQPIELSCSVWPAAMLRIVF